jgi:uncharacterized protein YukE
MSIKSKIRKDVAKINSLNSDFSRARSRCQGFVNESYSWWKGEAGKVLREEYKEIDTDIAKIILKMKSLESCTRRLANNVQRADDNKKMKVQNF